jgi:predicted HAD superfamily phosphohydrolase
MEKDLKHAYADHFAIRSKLNKILKSFKIADIDADDSFEKMAENDKHMIDLNIKELQETKKVINKIKKTVGGRKMRVSGGGDEP